MNARDFVAGDASVSRLDAVKRVFHDFVEGGKAGKGRPDDLVGLCLFLLSDRARWITGHVFNADGGQIFRA